MISPILSHDSRRRTILEEALQVFARYGFRKASMEQVAQAARISRQGLYLHFPSKEALFHDSVLLALNSSLAEAMAHLKNRERPLNENITNAFYAWIGKHIDVVGPNYTELLEAATIHVQATLIHDYEERFQDQLIRLLRDQGWAVICRCRGITVQQLTETLFMTARGLRTDCKTSAEYRSRMSVYLKVILNHQAASLAGLV